VDAPDVWEAGIGNVRQPHSLFRLKRGQEWPALPEYPEELEDAVRIEFEAGYTPGDPELELIKTWAKLSLGNLYENRESVVIGTISSELPGFAYMLNNVRLNGHPHFLVGAR
jgi:hypothetical protein